MLANMYQQHRGTENGLTLVFAPLDHGEARIGLTGKK